MLNFSFIYLINHLNWIESQTKKIEEADILSKIMIFKKNKSSKMKHT